MQAMPYSSHPIATALFETKVGLTRRRADTVLHFVADTGPLVSPLAPSVVTVHGVASRWETGIRNPKQEKIWRARVRQAIRGTDLVLTVSNSSADDLKEIFSVPESKLRVIPHGIEYEKFRAPIPLSDTIAARLPKDFLLYVGNIEPRKNLRELVRAVENPEVRQLGMPLVIAGKPAWNFDLEMDLIKNSASVIYLGFVSDSDRTALMQRTKLFLFPSRYEGFGFPVLEALACGAPVLATDRGALREVAGPAKKINGISSENIADAISEALGDSEWLAGIRVAGPEWAQKFTWPESVSAHIRAYQEVLAQ